MIFSPAVKNISTKDFNSVSSPRPNFQIYIELLQISLDTILNSIYSSKFVGSVLIIVLLFELAALSSRNSTL